MYTFLVDLKVKPTIITGRTTKSFLLTSAWPTTKTTPTTQTQPGRNPGFFYVRSNLNESATMEAPQENQICYLCGQTIDPKSTNEADRQSDDHVPAKVFYPKEYRKNGKLKRRLPKAPAHQGCNGQYKLDEQYFAMILAPLVINRSPGGLALFRDLRNQMLKYPDKTRWFSKIMNKTQYFLRRTVTGIILPQRKMFYPIDGPRIDRVVLKIARGIYYLNFKKTLPSNHQFVTNVYPPGVPLPEHLKGHL